MPANQAADSGDFGILLLPGVTMAAGIASSHPGRVLARAGQKLTYLRGWSRFCQLEAAPLWRPTCSFAPLEAPGLPAA